MFTYVIVIIPTYKKHQHRDYTYKTVQTVYAATKLTNSVYCNYNSWKLTALVIKYNLYRLYFITNYNDHICKHFNLLILLSLKP